MLIKEGGGIVIEDLREPIGIDKFKILTSAGSSELMVMNFFNIKQD